MGWLSVISWTLGSLTLFICWFSLLWILKQKINFLFVVCRGDIQKLVKLRMICIGKPFLKTKDWVAGHTFLLTMCSLLYVWTHNSWSTWSHIQVAKTHSIKDKLGRHSLKHLWKSRCSLTLGYQMMRTIIGSLFTTLTDLQIKKEFAFLAVVPTNWHEALAATWLFIKEKKCRRLWACKINDGPHGIVLKYRKCVLCYNIQFITL